MTTIPHEAPVVRRQIPAFWVRDMWPSLTIIAMWLAVLFDAVYGPDIVSTTPTTTSQIPSAVVMALCGSSRPGSSRSTASAATPPTSSVASRAAPGPRTGAALLRVRHHSRRGRARRRSPARCRRSAAGRAAADGRAGDRARPGGDDAVARRRRRRLAGGGNRAPAARAAALGAPPAAALPRARPGAAGGRRRRGQAPAGRARADARDVLRAGTRSSA